MRDFLIANNPALARNAVAARDAGICALCGLDCASIDNALMRLRWYANHAWRAWCGILGLPANGRSCWAADHIRPVVEGGGACGIENLRTLCWRCHAGETRALAGRRAKGAA